MCYLFVLAPLDSQSFMFMAPLNDGNVAHSPINHMILNKYYSKI